MLSKTKVSKVLKNEREIPKFDSLKNLLRNKCLSDDLKEILENLLQLNPYFRWTAQECLKHSYFDEIRAPLVEQSSKVKIKLAVDQDDSFDYASGESKYSLDDIINFIFEEVAKINEKRMT